MQHNNNNNNNKRKKVPSDDEDLQEAILTKLSNSQLLDELNARMIVEKIPWFICYGCKMLFDYEPNEINITNKTKSSIKTYCYGCCKNCEFCDGDYSIESYHLHVDCGETDIDSDIEHEKSSSFTSYFSH